METSEIQLRIQLNSGQTLITATSVNNLAAIDEANVLYTSGKLIKYERERTKI